MGIRSAAGILGVLFACTAVLAMTDEERAILKGRSAAAVLSDTLRGKLVDSMKAGGPSGAMKVCSYQAQALTREVEEREGVRVRRTSLKLRNPKNAPDEWERQVLSRLQEQARAGKTPEEVFEAAEEEGKKVFRYAKPLMVGPACIACHGSGAEISAQVRSMLQERYPEDRATGYKPGDFRGIVSAVVPAE